MHRRRAVKAIALGAVTPQLIFNSKNVSAQGDPSSEDQVRRIESDWHQWPDMHWTGPAYWGNRLQDWQVQDGKAVCVVSDVNRTLHALTCELSARVEAFQSSVVVDWESNHSASEENYVGFMLGAKGEFEDYRSAAVFGKGLRAGLYTDGRLFIGDRKGDKPVLLQGPFQLVLKASPSGGNYTVTLQLKNAGKNRVVAQLEVSGVHADELKGNIALLSHFGAAKGSSNESSASFSAWTIEGPKLSIDQRRMFGPVCFAQYTLHKNIVKMTAQLCPVERIAGHEITLETRHGDQWKTIGEGIIDPLGRSVHFRIEDWNESSDIPYRVQLQVPLKNGNRQYYFEGTIAAEPESDVIKMAVFSCNADFGFPDQDVHPHVNKHKPHLAVFLGDQFYERTGGFSIETSPLERSSLDYLRKWYMFGWSYREIFRHIPCACIPDDHDVYHGNVWGEGGKHASTDDGWGYQAQDKGGYKMPPEWVNMVQRTQTSHLPDAYDPTPVEQGIGVYYTSWVYGGISMAILEDRKFKSAPKQALPPEAKVLNGFIQNPSFDIKAHRNVKADLLGDRQLKFLNEWVSDWNGAEMKAVLSQTNFCAVATLPAGSILDDKVPQLAIPPKGEYVTGDAPTSDMDSNGWPQKGRDEAVKIIRKSFALHIAGDQHLASTVRYGVDEFGDAGFAFAGPALNNLWPRRWWPPVNDDHQPLPDQPAYTGNFDDGFGNKMTVLAVANPHQTARKPAIVYDRATGYGIVVFDKARRTMKIECWPRFIDPEKNPDGQYDGWPITVKQEENYGRKAVGYLPSLSIRGANDPVVKIIHEDTRELEYALRIKGNSFRPKVFSDAPYTVVVTDTASGREQMLKGVKIAADGDAVVEVDL